MDLSDDKIFASLVSEEILRSKGAENLLFNEKVKSLIRSGRNISHFAFGQSPFPVPNALVRNLQAHAHAHAYLPTNGIPELREALSAFHLKHDDLRLDPDHFIVGPGSKELIYLTINVFNGVILLPSPAWTTYEQQCHLSRKDPLVLNTDSDNGWKVTPDCIERGMECLSSSNKKRMKLLILTNPGNPTGICYTDQDLKEISACCRKNRVLVLSDEIYSRLTFNGAHSSILKFYPEGSIMANGFSKWASAGGWRIGYAYFPPALSSLFQAVLNSGSNTYSCAPAPMQYAVAKALEEDADVLEEYMRNCASVLQLVGDFCAAELTALGIGGRKSEAGYYYMPDFEVIRNGLQKRGILTGSQMTEAILKEADVALMSSETFLRPPCELSVRFCFVCFDGAKALEAYKDCKERGLTMKASDAEGQDFINEICHDLFNGLQRLKEWVLKHKE